MLSLRERIEVKVFLSCDATEYRQKNAARHFRHAASAINELWLLQLALHFLGKIEVFLDHL